MISMNGLFSFCIIHVSSQDTRLLVSLVMPKTFPKYSDQTEEDGHVTKGSKVDEG